MGLGDLVYYFTKYTGIRWLYKKIVPGCRCDERRKEWNSIKIIRNETIGNRDKNVGKFSKREK